MLTGLAPPRARFDRARGPVAVLQVFFVSGGGLLLLAATLPGHSSNQALLGVVAVVLMGVGGAMTLVPALPVPVQHVVVVAGTTVICGLIAASNGGVLAGLHAAYLVWIGVYAGLFFGRWATWAHLGLLAVLAYAAFAVLTTPLAAVLYMLLSVGPAITAADVVGHLVRARRSEAACDPATGALASTESIHHLLAATLRERSAVLVLLRVDRTAELREAFGHTEGDRLLLAVADRLRALPGVDGLARWSGNSFLLLLGDGPAQATAESVLAVLDTPFDVAGRTLHVTGSAGVAEIERGASPETALSRVGVAAGSAQREHDRVAVWSPGLAGICPEDLALVEDLRHAADRGELTLAYQPIVALGAGGGAAPGRTAALEALLRWDHPARGPISPALFVPLAERFAVTADLTAWVLDAALRQLAAWRAAGLDVGVAVNLSPTVLHDGTCAAMVADALTRHGVPPAALTLEITETAVAARPDRARTALAELDALGVRLSLDDFGTGYTSLVMLDELPLDEVKVDRAFVGRMLVDPARDAIACAIGSLCARLGVAVVAEGVEDAATLAHVIEAGFDLAQGFHLGRPAPAAAVPALLAALAGTAVPAPVRPAGAPAVVP